MNTISELNENQRITITISRKNYNKLKSMGFAGESYDTVLSNLFAKLEGLED